MNNKPIIAPTSEVKVSGEQLPSKGGYNLEFSSSGYAFKLENCQNDGLEEFCNRALQAFERFIEVSKKRGGE